MSISARDIERIVQETNINPREFLNRTKIEIEAIQIIIDGGNEAFLRKLQLGQPASEVVRDTICNSFLLGWICAIQLGPVRTEI